MKTNNNTTATTLLSLTALLAAAPFAAAGPTTPTRVASNLLTSPPYRTSGVVWGDHPDPTNIQRGSGTVAVNPRIAVSCAHVVFEDGRWMDNFKFAPAFHGGSTSHPENATNKTAFRGRWLWSRYSGGETASAYANDFFVHYAFSNLAGGNYAGWETSNSTTSHPLNGTGSKLIVGYPGSDAYYMNSVGPFTSSFTSVSGHYFWNPSVWVRPGMSGGGVFKNVNGDWRLEGVTVSAYPDRMGAGVRAIDHEAMKLVSAAIVSSGGGINAPAYVNRSFNNSSQVTIPDNNPAWTRRTLPLINLPSWITRASVSCTIMHPYKGDLEVMVTAPNGRSLMLHNRSGGSADNVIISGMDISSIVNGSNPNGTWTLSARDRAASDIGQITSFTVNLTSF